MASVAAPAPEPLSAELLARLPSSPDALPQKIDLVRQSVLVVRFDAAAYRAASFLDDRVLGPTSRGAWLSVAKVVDAAQRAGPLRPLHHIFHSGHVGSTLLSRLLDETGAVLSLREPLPLRTLADAHDVLGLPESLLAPAQFDALLGAFTRLWSRGYDGTQVVVLKATSSATRLAGPLLAAQPGSRAVCLNLRAEPYLATLLAGANSPLDLRGHGPGRMRRLQARVALPLAPLHSLSLGEMAAMSWLAETWAQHDALAPGAGRVMALDFDSLLADVPGSLGRVLAHFGLTANAADTALPATLARSPVLTQYSKAPEHAFSPGLRAELLHEARHEHRAEIHRGLAWIDRLARADRGVAEVVNARA